MLTNDFLSINDLSKYLGIKPKTLYSWVSKGVLPHYRIQGAIRFKRKDIDRCVEVCRRNGVDITNLKVREIEDDYLL
jgi:excisionase family DNA binding protein